MLGVNAWQGVICMCSMTTDQIAPVYLVIFFMIGGGQCGMFLKIYHF